MWIRTKGGYLLNTDNIEFIKYFEDEDITCAMGLKNNHSLCYGDATQKIADNLNRGTIVMEVR